MSDNPMPRPDFTEPTRVAAGQGAQYLWGDATSGEVPVQTLVWSEHLHCGLFSLPVGGRFGHSAAYPTVTEADEVWITIRGVYLMNCPATGEVHRVLPGEGVLSRPGTWHHGFSIGDEPLLMVEFLGGLAADQTRLKSYASTVSPPPDPPLRTQDQWLGRWPEARPEALAGNRLRVVRPAEALLRVEGRENPIPVEILASTPRLTVGRIRLLPGQRSDRQMHGGEEFLYVTAGTLNVRLPEHAGQQWHEAATGDSFFIPSGTVHQYFNQTDRPVELLFGVSPAYLPTGG
jgi:quercetin dioxygenase-like cupin family protein